MAWLTNCSAAVFVVGGSVHKIWARSVSNKAEGWERGGKRRLVKFNRVIKRV